MIALILLSSLILVALDVVFLTLTASIYAKQILEVQGTTLNINYIYAAVTYLVIIFALNYFILQRDASILEAGILGLSIYAIFELTNAALFTKWKLSTIILDTIWGGVLFASVTAIITAIKPYLSIK